MEWTTNLLIDFQKDFAIIELMLEISGRASPETDTLSIIGRDWCQNSGIERFRKNAFRLQSLIIEMEKFTEAELMEKFKEGGSTMIDSRDTPGDHLQRLVDIGYLRVNFGRYSVV